MEMATLNHERSATRSEGPSFDSVTPHSKTRIFTSVLGVDNIDYILSDLEDVSVGSVFRSSENTLLNH